MPPTQHEIDTWFVILDKLAEQANGNLASCIERTRESPAASNEHVAAGALVAIASQLAYGNAVAAAEFYMRFATPPKEHP